LLDINTNLSLVLCSFSVDTIGECPSEYELDGLASLQLEYTSRAETLALKFRGKWEGKPVNGSIWAQGPH